MEIREELFQFICEFVEEDKRAHVMPDSDLMEDLAFDSIQIMELFAALEEKYEIEFTDYERLLDSMDSVSQFVEYVSGVIRMRKEGELI